MLTALVAARRRRAVRSPARPPRRRRRPRQAYAGADRARPPARDELWVPIVLLALVVLIVEWAVYERDALVRAAARPRGAPGRRTGAGRRAA